MKTVTVNFTMFVPDRMTIDEVKNYVNDSVRVMGKSYFPGDEDEECDPAFEIMDLNSSININVTRVK